MYKVLKGFTSENISASKNKVIEITDKSLANSLIDAGLIEPFSNKEMSSAEKDKEISMLKAEVKKLEDEKTILITEKEELQATINEMLENSSEITEETENNLDNEDLDNNKDNSDSEDKKVDGEIVATPDKNKKE